MASSGSKTLLNSGVLYTDRRDFYIKPNVVAELHKGVAPFTTFVSKIKTRSNVKDPQFKMFEHRSEWLDMDFYLGAAIDWYDTLGSGAWEGTMANLAIEKTAGGGDAVAFLHVGDILEVRAASDGNRDLGSTGVATFVHKDQVVARLLVTAVDSTTQIDVENLSGTGADTYTCNDQDPVRVITNAQGEGTGSPTAWSDELVTVVGQCQILKTPLELTGTLANAKLRGYENERARLRDEKFKEHKMKMERMYLMGYMGQASLTDRSVFPTNLSDSVKSNQIRMSWGIIPLIQTYGTTGYQKFNRSFANYDMAKFIDDMEARTSYFDEDMVEYAFAGSKVLAELSKTGKGTFFERSGGAISISEWKMTRMGLKVRTLTHPFGDMHIIHSPVMRKAPYDNMMLIVDPANVERVIYRQTAYQTALQDNDLDGIKDQYFSDEGLGVTLIEKHCLFDFNYAV